MKLLTDSPEGIKFKEFSNDTPYVSEAILTVLDSVATTDQGCNALTFLLRLFHLHPEIDHHVWT